MWRRYGVAATFYAESYHQGPEFLRNALKRISGWRLKRSNYSFPIEHKLFNWYVRFSGQTQRDLIEQDRTSGVTPHAPA